MSYWGYFPKDGDYPSDLYGEVGRVINKWLAEQTKRTAKSDPKKDHEFRWAFIGLIQMLLQSGFFIDRKFVRYCVDWLNEFNDDANFMKEWEKADLAKKAIKMLYFQFLNLYERGVPDTGKKISRTRFLKKNPRILAPRLWLMRKAELLPGSWSGIWELGDDIKPKYPNLVPDKYNTSGTKPNKSKAKKKIKKFFKNNLAEK